MNANEGNQLSPKTLEALKILRERHGEIKSARRSLLTTLITINSSFLAGSIAFIKNIAAHGLGLWSMVASWLFFGIAVFLALRALQGILTRSQTYQRDLELALEESIIETNERRTPRIEYLVLYTSPQAREAEMNAIRNSPPVLLPVTQVQSISEETWCMFAMMVGIVFLAICAMLNLKTP